MSIFSAKLFYSRENLGFWEKITKVSYINDVHNIEYNPYYECYTMYGYSCNLYYSKDLVTWKQIYGNFIYNPTNNHYYKLTQEHVGNNHVLSIAEMTSLDVFGTQKTLNTVAYNSYTSGTIYNLVKLGNYYAFAYSSWSSIGNGASSKYNSYQKLFYTQDFKTWKVTSLYTKTNQSSIYDQITSLGSSGSKYILISDMVEGYRPVIFTSPTNYSTQAALWSGGNMTGDTGFYCNGNWHYCESGNRSTYLTSNGTNFTKLSSDYWRNPYMKFYQNHYITSNASTGQLRIYDSNFSTYSDIEIPCSKISRILGILNSKLYILDTNYTIYRTDISNLIT